MELPDEKHNISYHRRKHQHLWVRDIGVILKKQSALECYGNWILEEESAHPQLYNY